MARDIDPNNLSADDIKWILANHSNEHAKAYYGLDVESVGWNPLDMSNVPPVPVESQLDEHGRRHTPVQEGDEEAEEELIAYDDMKKVELQRELASRGLSTTGKNDELIRRLEEDDAEREKALYDEMPTEVLQGECRSRGLSVEGDKDTLALRLMEDDEAKEAGA